VLHLTRGDTGELTSTLDSLDQNARGVPVSGITFADNTLHVAWNAGQSRFDGTLSRDGTQLTGTFSQGPVRLPLEFARVDKTEIPAERTRPQEPAPPYPYEAEEVSYASGSVHLAGTLTIPRGGGPFPAAIMITGSGAQNRDEAIAGHKPFWIIADDLTRRGIAVLRVDDRGVGGSTGDPIRATLADLAGDVLAGVAHLKGRMEIDARYIGTIGHSEGGIVGPLAASRSTDVAFVVLLAGTGVPGEQVLYEQSALIGRAAGAPAAAIAQNQRVQKAMFDVLRTEPDQAVAADKLRAALEGFGLPDAVVETQIAQANALPMRSFLLHDPAAALRMVKAPVLALIGERDIQVSPRQNLPAIAAALAEGGNPDFTITELPGLNHLFQTCVACTVAEYGELDETFLATALRIMGDWIVRHTARGDQARTAGPASPVATITPDTSGQANQQIQVE
jgi:fermentation-respiration switch protein FrsA (DUF1100 family)